MKKIGVLFVIGFMVVVCNSLNAAADVIDCEPFFAAIRAGNVREVQIFWEANRGMKLEDRSFLGNTPLQVASLFGKTDVARLLLIYGANIEAKDNVGNRPLSMASLCGQKECVQLLLEWGANREAKNNDGLTAAEAARMRGRNDLAEFIESYQDLLEIKEPDLD